MNEVHHIAIIEDDQDLLFAFQMSLSKLPCQVDPFGDLESFSHYLQGNKPVLILMDVMLPDGNGIEFIAQLRKKAAYKNIGVIFVTGTNRFQLDTDLTIETGAIDYLIKPVDLATLLDKARIFLRVHDLLLERDQALKQFVNIFELTGDYVATLDEANRVLTTNPAFDQAFPGQNPDTKENSLPDFIVQQDLKLWEKKRTDLNPDRIIPPFELTMQSGDRLRLVQVSLLWFKNEHGKLSILFIGKDLTAERWAQEAGSDTVEAKELASLNLMSDHTTSLTAETYEVSTFSHKNQSRFDDFVTAYTQVVDRCIERRLYKIDYSPGDQLKIMTNQLGFIKAGPKDLIRIQKAFIQQKSLKENSRKMELLIDESRMTLLELMGYLTNYYRNRT